MSHLPSPVMNSTITLFIDLSEAPTFDSLLSGCAVFRLNPSTKRRPPSGVTIKHNFLPNETCDKLVAFAEMRKANRLKVRIPNSEIGAAQEIEGARWATGGSALRR